MRALKMKSAVASHWKVTMTNWEDREAAPKALPKAKPAPKKVMVTRGLLPMWPTTAFWIPGKTNISEKYVQEIDEMHQKLQGLQLAVVNRKGSILLHNNVQSHLSQPTLQKLNK